MSLEALQVVSQLKTIVVTIDSHLHFVIHVRNVAKACNYHNHTLRHDDVGRTFACSIVATRFDYCNALLCGAPEATLDKLQRVQNNLARIVCQRGGRADADPLPRSLHWLLMRQRVTHKMALTAHKVRVTAIRRTSATWYTRVLAQALWSYDALQMVVPCTSTDLAWHAFSVAAASVWNALPAELRLCNSTATYKRHLDTSVYTQLVTPHRQQHLCIFGLHCTLQMLLLLLLLLLL